MHFLLCQVDPVEAPVEASVVINRNNKLINNPLRGAISFGPLSSLANNR